MQLFSVAVLLAGVLRAAANDDTTMEFNLLPYHSKPCQYTVQSLQEDVTYLVTWNVPVSLGSKCTLIISDNRQDGTPKYAMQTFVYNPSGTLVQTLSDNAGSQSFFPDEEGHHTVCVKNYFDIDLTAWVDFVSIHYRDVKSRNNEHIADFI